METPPCLECSCSNYFQHTWRKNYCLNCSHFHQPPKVNSTGSGPLILKLGGGTDAPVQKSSAPQQLSSRRPTPSIPPNSQQPSFEIPPEQSNPSLSNTPNSSYPSNPSTSSPPPLQNQLVQNNPIHPPLHRSPTAPLPSSNSPLPPQQPMAQTTDNFHLSSSTPSMTLSQESNGLEEEEEMIPPMKITCTRDRVVNEILMTEQSYVHSLNTLIKTFLNPLRAENPPVVVPQTALNKIFSNIENLIQVNKHLLKSLETKIQDWDPEKTQIGSIFLEIAQPLRFSKTFAASHVQGLATLEECEKNPMFHNFCKEWKGSKHSKGLDIRSYLIMPIQRVPRYTLLLSELLKNTSENHPDYQNLQKARSEMENIAAEINEHVRLEENRQKILEIQESFGTNEITLVSPSRRYIRDGGLVKICRKARKQRWFFLFNDLLVYCSLPPLVSTAAPDRFKYHGSINLGETFRIDDVPDNNAKNLFNGFQIVSGTKSFVVIADSHESKIDWMLSISEVIRELKAKTKSLKVEGTGAKFEKPVWVTDDEASFCTSCQAEFTVFRRRHHCRACGQIFCANCSSRKITLPGDKETSRICENCFTKNPQLSGSSFTTSTESQLSSSVST